MRRREEDVFGRQCIMCMYRMLRITEISMEDQDILIRRYREKHLYLSQVRNGNKGDGR